MTPFAQAVAAVRKLYPRMSARRAELIVRTVLDAVASDAPRSQGKIGAGGEARFKDPT